MENIKLEPYAVKLRLSRLKNSSETFYNKTMIYFSELLARRCMSEKGALIGHIKGFAKGPQGSWLRVSITDGRRPADSEGRIIGRPEYVDLTLNIHVLGVSAKQIDKLLMDLIEDIAAEGKALISLINHEG